MIQVAGHHFHNEPHHKPLEGAQFVRETLIQNLLGEGDEVVVSAGPWAGKTVSVKDLGIGFPVIVEASTVRPVRVKSPHVSAGAEQPPGAAAPGTEEVQEIPLRRFDFIVQFCWQPTVPGEPKPKQTTVVKPVAGGE